MLVFKIFAISEGKKPNCSLTFLLSPKKEEFTSAQTDTLPSCSASTPNQSPKFKYFECSESFMDSMLISISEILSDKYFLKMCFYGKCEIIFISRRKSSSYCNPKCQTRAKSYRAYHSNDAIKETSNIEKTETMENIIATKLEPEKYEIPIEYDVDFGFFDDDQTKIRLLGS